jgi:hypothetical protein
MQLWPGYPTLADQHGKLGSLSTRKVGISRRRGRNNRSSGHLGRRGVVRGPSIGCQMTSGSRTCRLHAQMHWPPDEEARSDAAGHVDRRPHKKAPVLLLLKRQRESRSELQESWRTGRVGIHREEGPRSCVRGVNARLVRGTPTSRHLIKDPLPSLILTHLHLRLFWLPTIPKRIRTARLWRSLC